MTMKLEVNGAQYENFINASCEIRLDALSSTFSFEAAAAEGEPLPFKGGEACKIIVDGELVLTGSIEVVDVSYDAKLHSILIQGRDRTGDLLDSSLGPIADIREAATTLKKLIEIVLKDIKLKIDVIDLANPAPFNEAEDVASPEPGENAFSFIEKYSKKRQVLLTSDADGNVVIAKNSGETAPGAVQHVIGASDNNVLAASFSFDTTGRYNQYKFVSQLNPIPLEFAGETDLATAVNQTGGASDPDIRIGRQLFLVAEAPYSNDQNIARAKWQLNIARARGLAYAATVPGYRVDLTDPKSALWQTNKLYQIVDDFLGKREQMLCNSVTYTLDSSGGQQTSLGFLDETTYALDLTKPSTSSVADDLLGDLL